MKVCLMLLSFSTNFCRMFNGTLRDILLKLRDILLRLRVIIDSISDVILWREEYSRYDIARPPNNKKNHNSPQFNYIESPLLN